VRGIRGADETIVQVLVQELSESHHLNLGKQIHPSNRRLGALVKIYLEVVGSMRGKCTGLGLAKNICELVVLLRDAGQVYRVSVSRKTSSGI
jgi:hypothetical protein